jgi:mannitol 2-dehydrogenase
MADPVLRAFVIALLHEEVKPTLPRAAGIDVDEYIDSLIERFSNPAVGDQIARLCQDGTAKFPKFLLPTIRARLEDGGTVTRSALALAGWCEYLATSENPSSDPRLAQAVGFAQRSLVDPGSFLDFADVFGTGLADSDHLRSAFATALRTLRADGVQSTVRETT